MTGEKVKKARTSTKAERLFLSTSSHQDKPLETPLDFSPFRPHTFTWKRWRLNISYFGRKTYIILHMSISNAALSSNINSNYHCCLLVNLYAWWCGISPSDVITWQSSCCLSFCTHSSCGSLYFFFSSLSCDKNTKKHSKPDIETYASCIILSL